MNCCNDIITIKLAQFLYKVNYCKLVNYFNFSVDVYHFDNRTTTGTSVIATEKNICATNNDYHLIILPVVFCFTLVLFILSVILFTMTFVVIKNRNTR